MAWLLSVALFGSTLCAAAERPAAQEVWAGTYRCGPAGDAGQSAGYTTPIRLVLEEQKARVSRDTARIAESMAGEVGADGILKLEGTGRWKDSGSSGWRYRFDGKFEGDQFNARGEMLSANRGTKLRECSMALARVKGAGAAPRVRADKVAPAAPAAKPAASSKLEQPLPPAVADALLPPKEKTLLREKP